jgi:hypothetical protein
VLAHGDLREPIDIKRLALLVRNADYKPRVRIRAATDNWVVVIIRRV